MGLQLESLDVDVDSGLWRLWRRVATVTFMMESMWVLGNYRTTASRSQCPWHSLILNFMSTISTQGPEAQNSLFVSQDAAEIPQSLARATSRLQFPPSYVIVGVYRLCTDRLLYVPAWQKCQHGTQRGLAVGLVWVNVCRSWDLIFHWRRFLVTFDVRHSEEVHWNIPRKVSHFILTKSQNALSGPQLSQNHWSVQWYRIWL